MISFSKWVSCWGNATSITDRREAVYSKDLTLRYPIRMCFSGSMLRLRFSNLTGTEPVTLSRVSLMKADAKPVPVLFGGSASVCIQPGCEVESDATPIPVSAGETVRVSIYLGEVTQMNAGTLITGPLSRGQYAYGDYADADVLPQDLTRNTNWFYFLNTVDILTEEQNYAVVCFGDSITAQSWPDCLQQQLWEAGRNNVAVIRRAVSGTRVLRQYDCITYQAYGLKGAVRFPIEMRVSGARVLIIQHGINDIIHPVGTDVNVFRPWSDLPTVGELCRGIEELYVVPARRLDLRILSGTLLPILGWRTYTGERDRMRSEVNEWLRNSPIFDGCIDFDLAVRDAADPRAFAPGFDSGDHLHPSEAAYEAMARAALPLV